MMDKILKIEIPETALAEAARIVAARRALGDEK